jgi:diguanylate cyclase (GGDEF)-like protein
MQSNDLPVMISMVDAIFDRGFYQSIVVETVDGETLIERNSPVDSRDVPGWFTRYFSLDVPTADAVVMSAWKQAATVNVASHPGHAYRELWNNTVDTLWLFSISAIIVLLLGLTGIHLLLKPLRRVELQAEAICNRSYAVQESLPQTRELRTVVKAMNRLAGKVNDIITDQSGLTERLREQAYMDPVSGLGNRRYFNRQLRNLIESPEQPAQGAVLLLELDNLDEINTTSGFQSGDRLLQRAGELIAARAGKYSHCYSARISGAGFGIIIVDISETSADALASDLARDMLQLHIEQLTPHEDVAHIGVALWQPGDTVSAVLAAADLALQSARAEGGNNWFRHESSLHGQTASMGAGDWQEFLDLAIRDNKAVLYSQNVVRPAADPGKPLHREILLRLPGPNGDLMPAAVFMPMAEYMGLAKEFDMLTINRALELAAATTDTRYAINLTSTVLHDPGFVAWLCERLGNSGHTDRIFFEVPEYGVLRNIESAREFIRQVKAAGCNCGIDHFGRGFSSFGYLRSIGIQYLKIDGSYIHDIDKDADNRFFVQALVDTAHGLDITVIAETVETQEELEVVSAMNVDGIQGYLTGKPEPIQ